MTRCRLGKPLRIFLVLCLVVIGAVAWFVTRMPASPFDGLAASANLDTSSPELVLRGQYVARLGDCVACHSSPNQPAFSGGLEMATPLGTIFATNITPDTQTGIGNYSLADFDRAIRRGAARDGHRLYPAMPYPSYAKLSDDDVRALYAYFMHEARPVQAENKPSKIPSPWNWRWPLAIWSAVFADSGAYQAKNLTGNPRHDSDASNDSGSSDNVANTVDPKRWDRYGHMLQGISPIMTSETWNRGAYLVQGAGHCGACHTPRGSAMNEKALDEGSPLYLSGALLDGWYAPSLRGDPNTGLGRWSVADIAQFLKTGRNQHTVVFGSMLDAVNNSTQFMTDEDLQAIAVYLKSLPGTPGKEGPPWQPPATASGNAPTLDERQKIPGAQTFMARCASCHGADGRGQGQWIPPLAGAASAMTQDNASSINITLNGSGRVVVNGIADAYRMPPLRNQLSDQEIADVLTFIRMSWGNQGGAVKAEDVMKLRARTNPASSQVIVLQMR